MIGHASIAVNLGEPVKGLVAVENAKAKGAIEMQISVVLIAENLLEEAACTLIHEVSAGLKMGSQNSFSIETKDLARAADLLHAIRVKLLLGRRNNQ